MSDFTPSVTTTSITAGGTSEVLLAADPARQTVFIQPQTEACLINFGATAGTQATGTLTAGANPAAAVTIAVNGVTFTFIAGASTATDVHIGADEDETMTNFAAVLNASANASISVATYSVAGAVLTVTYDAGGTTGNAFTLADSSGAGAVTRSAATLTGGSDTVGGVALATNASLSWGASDYPQIKNAIYVVSATTAAKVCTTYGLG